MQSADKHARHRRNNCFIRFFIQVTFFKVFLKYFFRIFLFLKTLSKAKYEYAKLQRETLFQDASAMIFIDFGLLHSPHCKVSYLLKSAGGN